MRPSRVSLHSFVVFFVYCLFVLDLDSFLEVSAANTDNAPSFRSTSCSIILRYVTRPIAFEGNRNCTATGPLLSCGGLCNNKAEPVHVGSKVVYIPDCHSCKALTRRTPVFTPLIVLVPNKIRCRGVMQVFEKRLPLLVPDCKCYKCSKQFIYDRRVVP